MERPLNDADTVRDVYALMTALVVPRPIAWIATRDPNLGAANGAGGVDATSVNLAPFSYFNAVCSDPALVSVSIAHKRDGILKDTLRLIRETKVFCINLVEEHDLTAMHLTSAELPPGESEAVANAIPLLPCVAIDSARVGSARAAFECRLVEEHIYGNGVPVSLVIGEVLHLYVADELLDEHGAVDGGKVRPVARLGGSNYGLLGERRSIPRPPRPARP